MSTTRRLTTTSLIASSLSWLLAAGCSGGEFTAAEDAELARFSSELRKGEPGASNGSGDFCDGPTKCSAGEGDCDYNAQCDAGLVCGSLNGSRFNLYSATDVCWPAHCQNGVLDGDEQQTDAGGSCGCILQPHYYDPDGDGVGTNITSFNTKSQCSPSPGWAATRGDCNDSDATVYSGAPEICGDGKDNDCNGQVDETRQVYYYDPDRDGVGTNNTSFNVRTVCGPTDGWAPVRGDCNDSDPSVYTGATEVCGDRKDNNCNGQVDENALVYYYDPDRDGFGSNNLSLNPKVLCAPQEGWAPTRGDCVDSDPAINPNAWEICDNKDNNCNGVVDETKPTWCQDSDLDGWPRNNCVTQCAKPNWTYVAKTTSFDCNDTNKNVYPGAFETQNNVDDDCDGVVDNSSVPATCRNGVKDGTETGVDCGGPCNVCGPVTTGPSCAGLANTCLSNQNCCNTATVFGGSFFRSYDGTAEYPSQASPATVDSFRMDLYEVTVGRFRKFVAAYDSWRAAANPVAGAGAHPLITGSGWTASWPLPASATAMVSTLKCDASQQTWTDAATAADNRPINCVNFFEANAFCIWDGGRLPTEAEWNYAAAGGAQHRTLPWAYPNTQDVAVDLTRASFGCIADGLAPCTVNDIERAGGFLSGAGRWGQISLAGGLWEWNFDWYNATYPTPCVNCAQTTASSQWRSVRGGSYQSWPTDQLRVPRRGRMIPESHVPNVGFRCVR